MTTTQNSDELKRLWRCQVNETNLDDRTLNEVIKDRARKSVRNTAKYFWSAFFYQNFMYAFCAWNLLTAANDGWLSIICGGIIAVYVPYTVIMIRRFRLLSVSSSESLLASSERRMEVITGFLKFKKWYEGITLLPVTLFLTLLIYVRWVPQAVSHHDLWLVITWVITAFAFYLATAAENRKRFARSIDALKGLIEELNSSH